MFFLTCTMISSVDLAHYEVSRAKDRVSVDCGTIHFDCRNRLPQAVTNAIFLLDQARKFKIS